MHPRCCLTYCSLRPIRLPASLRSHTLLGFERAYRAHICKVDENLQTSRRCRHTKNNPNFFPSDLRVLPTRATPWVVLAISRQLETLFMRLSRSVFAPRALALSLFVAGAIPAGAQAQADAPAQVAIAAQPLGQALHTLAQQTGLQLLYAPAVVAGKQGPAVSGSMAPRQALAQLLAGSGLVVVPQGRALVIKPAEAAVPQSGAETTLVPVTVQADALRESASGPVGGLVARRSATATKTDTPLSETPMSVTVVPREQIVAPGR